MSKDLTMKQFSEYLSQVAPLIEDNMSKSIKLCCDKVRSDIQESMAKTERDMSKA